MTEKELEKLNNEIWEKNDMTKLTVILPCLLLISIAFYGGILWLLIKFIRLFL